MNRNRCWKMIPAPLIGLAMTVAVFFLLFAPDIWAAELTPRNPIERGLPIIQTQGGGSCIVTSTADSGDGTLRQCLLNAGTSGITITFNLMNPATITLTSGYLSLATNNITIDGSGAGVIISGGNKLSSTVDGFRITSNNNTIKGLTIQNFPSDGVEIRNGSGNRIENCIIRGNGRRGVRVEGNGTTSNTITKNSITNNDGPGIENSNGGNQELAWPIITQIITSASGITVSGFAHPGVTVEVFADPATEGQIFLGDDVAGSTRRFTVFSSTTSLDDMNITATATDGEGNTSEFAQALIWPFSRSTTPDESLTDKSFSSPFGPRLKASEYYRYDFHRGLDTYAVTNTSIYAVADGQVRITGTHSAYNSTVVQLCHPDCGKREYYSNYLHIITPTNLISGQSISQGQFIAYSGKSENEQGFEHLHFEIRERYPTQKYTVNPFKYLPYTDTVSHTVAISGIYVHNADGDSFVTARAVVTSPRNELDFNRITMEADYGSGIDQRTIDFQALNKEMTTLENPEILDNPYINNVCIMPARFCSNSNDCKEYRIDFVFYGLQGSDSITLTAEAADVHTNVVSTTASQVAEGITISPDSVTSYVWSGNVITYTHVLSNNSGISHTFNLSATSAQSWTTRVSPTFISLDDGVKAEITVYITVPTGIPSGRTDCTVIIASDVSGTIQMMAVDVTRIPYVVFLPIILKN